MPTDDEMFCFSGQWLVCWVSLGVVMGLGGTVGAGMGADVGTAYK